MKILLVDDEQKFINMLAKRMAIRGIEADVAYTGEDALKKAGNMAYDVAVLDLKMPGISGIHLKNKLSALHADLKFIFVTGHGAVEKSEDAEADKDIYLSKPLDIDFLIKTIDDLTKTG
ncbi:MAG: response regulator [Desulfobacula sp.]|jgi:DNA-binding response OmpR family regulator